MSISNGFLSSAPGTNQSPAGGVAAIDCGCVLVVDDEEGVRAVISLLLRRRGYRVVEAEDGSQALEHYVANPTTFSVMLVDLSMPHMDGSTFLAAVRSMNASQPVIAMSGYDLKEARRVMGSEAIAGYLQKPFSPEQLFELIGTAVAGSR